MRALSFFMLLVAVAMAADRRPIYDLNDAPALFEKFVKDYDRHYKDDADRELHYQAFRKSLESINKLNENQSSATYDINKFADYTDEEMSHMHGLRPPLKAE